MSETYAEKQEAIGQPLKWSDMCSEPQSKRRCDAYNEQYPGSSLRVFWVIYAYSGPGRIRINSRFR